MDRPKLKPLQDVILETVQNALCSCKTKKEAAAMLKIDRKTLNAWIRRGGLTRGAWRRERPAPPPAPAPPRTPWTALELYQAGIISTPPPGETDGHHHNAT